MELIGHTVGVEVAVDLYHHHSLSNLTNIINLTSVINLTNLINLTSFINLMNFVDPVSFQHNLEPVGHTVDIEAGIDP